MKFDGLLETIESYETITIFRHVNPDCDAVGSQLGLKNWLKDNYPNKKVYALGHQKCTQGEWPNPDKCEDDIIKSSLAIVVDTANEDRVDDERFHLADKIIKIDHHPNKEPFGDMMFVNEEAAAVCQILTAFFHSNKDKELSKQTAEYLYRGLLTDTLNYTTSNTTPETLELGGVLASRGIDLSKISHDVFDNSLRGYKFTGYLISNTQIKNEHLGYVIIPRKEYMKYGFSASDARSFVGKLGNVKDFDIWCIFTEKKDDDGNILYDGSLRAKSLQVNDVAEKYGGGGHKQAAGVKNLTQENLEDVLNTLASRV